MTDQDGARADHPIREGAILRRIPDSERTEPLLEVAQRLEDIDSGHYEYVLKDPTHTTQYTYHQEDVDDVFSDTSLTNEEIKPVMQADIRGLYQELCPHSWHVVHDSDTLEPTGEQCISCRKRRVLVE